jgi:hypothetical protein
VILWRLGAADSLMKRQLDRVMFERTSVLTNGHAQFRAALLSWPQFSPTTGTGCALGRIVASTISMPCG